MLMYFLISNFKINTILNPTQCHTHEIKFAGISVVLTHETTLPLKHGK
jgi:hypothetical protein